MYFSMKIFRFSFLVLLVILLSGITFHAEPISFDFDEVLKYKTKNKKGKSTHTIVSQTGKAYPIYIAVDTSTMIVTPYPIVSISNPARDVIHMSPEITPDSPGDNFVTFKVAGNDFIGNIITVHLICDKGYKITLVVNISNKVNANRDIYIIDQKQLERRKTLSREDEIKLLTDKYELKNKNRELILANLFFNHTPSHIEIDEDVNFKGKEVSLQSITSYSDYVVFNVKMNELGTLFKKESILLEIKKVSGTGMLKRTGKKEVYELDSMVKYASIGEPFVSLVFKTNKKYDRFESVLKIDQLSFETSVDFSTNEINETTSFDTF